LLLDLNLLFYHTGASFAFTAGEYVSLSGLGTASACASAVINLGVPEDMGIGDGEFIPHIMLSVGTGITSACASTTINAAFQGSTDSSNWTTYIESGPRTTASLTANTQFLPQAVPRRPGGFPLPQYYRVLLMVAGVGGAEVISAGSIIGGIVIQRQDDALYPAGYVVS
jgi:hypothetical protein